MKFKIFILIIIVFIPKNIFSAENKILFKVNNEIITTIDILNERNYLGLLNNRINELDENKIYEISKNSLITEKIKKIELEKKIGKIKINNSALEPVLLDYFKFTNVSSMDELKKYFNRVNLNLDTIKLKISIELLWNSLIYEKFSKKIKIDKAKIKELIKSKETQNEYLLSELVFSVENKNQVNKKYELIKKNINEKGFSNSVLIHSTSVSAKNRGNLGWIKESSLSSKVINELKKIEVGQITKPIQIPGGFLIIKIENSRKVKINLNLEKELDLATKSKINEQLSHFSNIYFQKVKKNISINEI